MRGHAVGRTFILALVLLAVAQVAAAGATTRLALVAAVLAVGALATSPVHVLAFSRADALVPPQRRTEASTWVTVGANLGTTAGTAAAGAAAGLSGSAPFELAALLTAAAAATNLMA